MGPGAAAYQTQAAAIYNPQLAADTQVLNGTQAANQASYTANTNAANQAYNQALVTQTRNEGNAENKVNFAAARTSKLSPNR